MVPSLWGEAPAVLAQSGMRLCARVASLTTKTT